MKVNKRQAEEILFSLKFCKLAKYGIENELFVRQECEKLFNRRYGSVGCDVSFFVDAKTDTQAVIVSTWMFDSPDGIHVAIRGTSEKRDWRTNLKAYHAEIGDTGLYGHAGCVDAAMALYRSLDVNSESHIQIHGHSLGGGIAQVLCLLIESDMFLPPPIYPHLRSPMRSLSPEAAGVFDEQWPGVLRTHHRWDLVKHVPFGLTYYPFRPHRGFYRYKHVGKSVPHGVFPDRVFRALNPFDPDASLGVEDFAMHEIDEDIEHYESIVYKWANGGNR